MAPYIYIFIFEIEVETRADPRFVVKGGREHARDMGTV
jgi:hypothetical protein